eukprot:5380942-Pyramimonas_sp.AAC.1
MMASAVGITMPTRATQSSGSCPGSTHMAQGLASPRRPPPAYRTACAGRAQAAQTGPRTTVAQPLQQHE